MVRLDVGAGAFHAQNQAPDAVQVDIDGFRTVSAMHDAAFPHRSLVAFNLEYTLPRFPTSSSTPTRAVNRSPEPLRGNWRELLACVPRPCSNFRPPMERGLSSTDLS